MKDQFLDKLEISQTELAVALGTTFRTVNEIVNEKRNISAEMAIKLSRFFSTDVELWLTLQNQYDVHKIYLKKKKNIDKVKPLKKNGLKTHK